MPLPTVPGLRRSLAALAVLVLLLSACTAASGPAASGGSGTIPSNQCAPVTAADVEAAYGGSSSPAKVDEHGHCAFEVSGNIHAGPNAGTPGEIGVSFNNRYTTFADAKVVFGDGVTKVDGLGVEAWWALQTVHVKIAGGEMAVIGLWIGNLDKAIIQKDTITLAKTILSHL